MRGACALENPGAVRTSENCQQAKFKEHFSPPLLDIALHTLLIPKIMNFGEFCTGEVRRITLPRTRVNKRR